MAKLTTHTTGKVENTLTVSREEVIGMLREKFPMIPADRSVDIQFEVDACRDLNEVVVEWKSTTDDQPVEREVQPVKAGCGRVCAKSPINIDASAFDDMRPPTVAPDYQLPEAHEPGSIKHVMIPHRQIGRIGEIQDRESNE